ncbi:MAG TPA: protein kinase [Actinoplanes sp.]|nr:protein kinase [Actinoplanes sp.]
METLRSADPVRLGGYRVVGRLGRGGMGVVYLAENRAGDQVAIKLIHADLAADPEFSGRFRSEVERARQVPPFCTAEFIDADLDHDPPYLVTEYVNGPSLEEVVTEQGPLKGGALHSLAVGVATALTGIHGAGVIHRDLKPDNVLLPPGSPKVIDFGIARPFEATSHHTQTDVLVGTVPYMAPERFSEDPRTSVTAASDVFAWGCVIAYAGTGSTPFLGDSASSTAGRILTQPPRLDGLPESLRGPIALALAKHPEDRPSARDLLAMLVGEKAVPGARGNHRVLAGVLAGVLGLTAATGGYLLLRPDAEASAKSSTRAPTSGVSAGQPPASSAAQLVAPALPRDPAAATKPSTSQATPTITPRVSAPTSLPERRPDTVGPGALNPGGRNLALNSLASASSLETGQWSAAAAVDGDPLTRWSSGYSDPQWLALDLGRVWQLNEIVVHWENAYATSYRVQVSTDGTRWASVFSTTNGQGGTVTVDARKRPGRYVRVFCTERSNQYGDSIYELEVR